VRAPVVNHQVFGCAGVGTKYRFHR
jgi:hypothetical protein